MNHIANILLVKREQMTRYIQGGVEGYGDAAVQAYRRIKDAVEIAERDAALGLIVDEEAQCVRGVQVEEDTDSRALLNAALGALRVTTAMHEPRPLSIYVHAPALVVLTYKQTIRKIARANLQLPGEEEEIELYYHVNDRINVRNKNGQNVCGYFINKNIYIN